MRPPSARCRRREISNPPRPRGKNWAGFANLGPWNDIWLGRIQVDAPGRWQALLDAALQRHLSALPRRASRPLTDRS